MKIQLSLSTSINNNPSFKKKKNRYTVPELSITEANKFHYTSYSKPVTLKKALYDIVTLPILKEGIVGEKAVIQGFIDDLGLNKKLLKKKVVRLAGYGASAVAFETSDGKILKLTSGNHFPMNRPHEIFDVPVYLSGNHGKTYFYVEEKLYQHNMPQYFVSTVKDMIHCAGYRTSDLYSNDTHQIGVAKNGRVYLLDAECAKYKSVFHAFVDKTKRFVRKII